MLLMNNKDKKTVILLIRIEGTGLRKKGNLDPDSIPVHCMQDQIGQSILMNSLDLTRKVELAQTGGLNYATYRYYYL